MMLKRCVTGAVMIAAVVGFFFLREIDARYFDILIGIIAVAGTAEVLRAFRGKAYAAGKAGDGKLALGAGDVMTVSAVMLAAAAFVPVHAFFGLQKSALVLASAALVIMIVKAFSFKNYGEETLLALFAALYPNAFLLAMLYVNSLPVNGTLALVMIFVISPLADTFAYIVGSIIGGKKLCPAVSPNKTISGAVGGLAGGALGALALYYIFRPQTKFAVPALVFFAIGLAGAFFTEAGDLFESFIKRRCNIKDMGKILPGHGGVMDRIDGMLFASAFVALVFTAV